MCITCVAQTGSKSTKTFEFSVAGMTCNNCAETITNGLKKLDGVIEAKVDFENKQGKVIAANTVTEAQIKKAIANLNFEALFGSEKIILPLTDKEKAGLDIATIKGGRKIRIEDHLVKDKITIFDFYADWCGPCKLFTPKLEQLLLTYPNLALCKVDMEDWKSDLAKQLTKVYKLPSLPFTLIFNDKGKLLGKIAGNHIEKVEDIINPVR